MTVVSGIKINGAIAGSADNAAGTGSYIIYTAPADCYAIVQLSASSSGANTAEIRIGGLRYLRIVTSGSEIYPTISASPTTIPSSIYVGPGQVMTLDSISGTDLVVRATGVEFKNS